MTQPAALTGSGVVRCAFCRTDQYGLPDHLLGENHGGIRFKSNLQGRVTVYLEDEDVTGDCVEFLAGPEGWVVLYARRAGKRYLCGFDYSHAVVEKHWGKVVVKRRG